MSNLSNNISTSTKKSPRGPTTPPAIRWLVTQVFADLVLKRGGRPPIPTAQDVRREAARQLLQVQREKGDKLSAALRNAKAPNLPVIYKLLEGPRSRLREVQEPEKEWRFHDPAAKSHEGIPDDALGDILRVWKYRREHGGGGLTLAEARWISRLRHTPDVRSGIEVQQRPDPMPDATILDEYVRRLSGWATVYASLERVALLTGDPPSAETTGEWAGVSPVTPDDWDLRLATDHPSHIFETITDIQVVREEESDGEA